MSNLAKVLHPEEDCKQKSLERRLSFYTQTGVWIDKSSDTGNEYSIAMEYIKRMRRDQVC